MIPGMYPNSVRSKHIQNSTCNNSKKKKKMFMKIHNVFWLRKCEQIRRINYCTAVAQEDPNRWEEYCEYHFQESF